MRSKNLLENTTIMILTLDDCTNSMINLYERSFLVEKKEKVDCAMQEIMMKRLQKTDNAFMNSLKTIRGLILE